MDFENSTVKYSEIKQNALLADLYSKVYSFEKPERVKVLMSWLANAYSDLFIPFIPENEALDSYIVHVRLLDTFANNSPYDVVAQLATEFSESFLKCQVIPNLLEPNYERTADITYFIQILCQNLSCPSLIRKVMDVVSSQLTPVFIARMTSDNHLVATSTLSLLKSLLEFYCEDLWYDLMLQYLLPMKHLLTSQRQKMLPDVEFHESTSKLLELIPKHVGNTINPSVLAEHFLLYFQDEINRLDFIDSAVATSLPSSKSELRRVGLAHQEDMPSTSKRNQNPTYPMWIFKYDGTDILLAFRRGSFLPEEPEEFFEDDLFSVTNQLNSSFQTEEDFYSRSQLSNDENTFALANVSAGEIYEDSNSLGFTSIESNTSFVKDKRKSMAELDEGGTYFGPFLQSLYGILKKWTVLHPDVLFVTTEIISVLASSRIPLINTIFLDMSLTLQPSYPGFSNLLHSIQQDLDNKLGKCPDSFFRNVWKSAARECTGTTFFTKEEESSSFVNTLRRTIAQNRSFRMAAGEVQRSVGKRSSFRAFTDIFKGNGGGNDFRLLPRTASTFNSEEEEAEAKVMALRSVLFTHWLLELGAIAMQLCWGRKSFQRGSHAGNISDLTHSVEEDSVENNKSNQYDDEIEEIMV